MKGLYGNRSFFFFFSPPPPFSSPHFPPPPRKHVWRYVCDGTKPSIVHYQSHAASGKKFFGL